MRPLFLSLLSLVLPLTANGEVFKCGNVWSSKPCGDESRAVENLPRISRVESPLVDSENAKDETSLEEPTDSSCVAQVGGTDLRIITASVKAVESAGVRTEMLKGVVKNFSSNNVKEGVTLVITDTQKQVKEIPLSPLLLGSASATFSEVLSSTTIRGARPGKYALQLKTGDQLFCKTRLVSSEQAPTSRGRFKQEKVSFRGSSRSAFERSLEESILGFEQAYKAIRANTGYNTSRLSSRRVGEAEALRTRVSSFCRTQKELGNLNSGPVIPRCMELLQRISALIQEVND